VKAANRRLVVDNQDDGAAVGHMRDVPWAHGKAASVISRRNARGR
jgi:hypothetical protein